RLTAGPGPRPFSVTKFGLTKRTSDAIVCVQIIYGRSNGMWSTEYSQNAEVAPEALWKVLRDVNGWGAWNEGIETIAMDDPLAVGATFQMKPPGEDMVTSTIAELEENRVLTDVTDLGDLVVRVAHRLDPLAEGGTAITYAVE